MKRQEVLYCSTLCSENLLDYLLRTSVRKPLNSIQKFHRLFTEGLITYINNITALSSIPVTIVTHQKIFWKYRCETHTDIKYVYPPFLNFSFSKPLLIFLFSFFYTVLWCLKRKKQESVIICDVLNVSISTSSLIAAKILGYKTCGIVTDIPDMMKQKTASFKSSILEKCAVFIGSKIITFYDSYLLLTEKMNEVVNKKNKPFIVMEGLVDISMKESKNLIENKFYERVLLYSGGIYEKYGIKNLLEAFMRLPDHDIRLHIFGFGEMEKEMTYFMNLDKRIRFFGVVPNKEVVENQIRATLLLNPRPSNQEFTKYSFPSKNMEYMVSGTPLVTTALPGMPDEYKSYVYIFDDESKEGLYRALQFLLTKSRDELHCFGIKAKEFVLNKKNNMIQAQKLINLLNTL